MVLVGFKPFAEETTGCKPSVDDAGQVFLQLRIGGSDWRLVVAFTSVQEVLVEAFLLVLASLEDSHWVSTDSLIEREAVVDNVAVMYEEVLSSGATGITSVAGIDSPPLHGAADKVSDKGIVVGE